MELMIHGMKLTLRLDDAEKIDIDQESVTGGEDDRHRSEDERRWNGSRHDDNSRMASDRREHADGRRRNIPDWEKKAAIMSKPTPAGHRNRQNYPSLPQNKTAVRPHFSTNSPVPTSMWAIFRE